MIGIVELLFFVAFSAYIAYWVIRLAVRHGLRDARAEAGAQDPLTSATSAANSASDMPSTSAT